MNNSLKKPDKIMCKYLYHPNENKRSDEVNCVRLLFSKLAFLSLKFEICKKQ